MLHFVRDPSRFGFALNNLEFSFTLMLLAKQFNHNFCWFLFFLVLLSLLSFLYFKISPIHALGVKIEVVESPAL